MKERIEWIDIAKGIGILAIIAGHFGCPEINRVVFPWHVPMFYFIAGFFLSSNGNWWSFVTRKAKAQLIPYVLSGLSVVVIGAVLNREYNNQASISTGIIALLYGAGSPAKFLFEDVIPIGCIWFFQALFWGLLITRIAIRFSVRIGILFCFTISCLCWFSAKWIWLPVNIQSGGAACLAIYMGYLCYNQTSFMRRFNKWLILIGVIAFIFMIFWGRLLCCVNCSGSFISYIGSLFVSYPILVLCYRLDKFPHMSFLRFIGRNSALFLCFHLFELTFIPWRHLLCKVSLLIDCGTLPCRVTIPLVFVLKVLFSRSCKTPIRDFAGVA